MYLLLDKENIVRCVASEECNLHKDKIAAGMETIEADYRGICGDKYFPETGIWERHPENYVQPSESEVNEAKIAARIRQIAVDQLKEEGELPPNYRSLYAKDKT